MLRTGLGTLAALALVMTVLFTVAAISEYRREIEKPQRYKCSYFVGGAVMFGFGSMVLIAGTIFTSKKIRVYQNDA